MKKIKVSSYFLFLFLFSGVVSCSKKPKVTIKAERVVIRRITLSDMTLEMNYSVKNPYHVAIKVKKINQSVTFDGVKVGTGNLQSPVEIPAKSTKNLKVDFKIPFKTSLKPVVTLLKGDEIKYSISSVTHLSTILGSETRTIVRDGAFKLPIKPGGGPFKVSNLRLEGGKLKFTLHLKVPRPEKQVTETTKVNYKISIGNDVISEGSFDVIEGKTPFQIVKTDVVWPFNKGPLWLAKFATTGLKYKFYLKFDLGDDTVFIIDKDEKLDVTKLIKPSFL